MSQEDGWWNQLVQMCRQITTPITMLVLLGLFDIILAKIIAGSSLDNAWKGALVCICVVGFFILLIVSLLMSIWFPRNLTFDKEAHIEIDVRLRSEQMTVVTSGFQDLLMDLSSANEERLRQMADGMREGQEDAMLEREIRTGELGVDQTPVDRQISP